MFDNTSNFPEANPEVWVDDHGDFLFHFALLRLSNNTQLAEDMVQDTFLSALKSKTRYEGRSSERTWLVSILKNKIIDHYRKNKKKLFVQLDDQNEAFFSSGARKGQWKDEFAPAEWGDSPEKLLEKEEFAVVFRDCMGNLAPSLSSTFILREMDDWDTKKICKEMSITPSNLWVMLHRARNQLRRCLETNWFLLEKRRSP